MRTKLFIKIISLTLVVVALCGLCGCSRTVYTPADIRAKEQDLLNYRSEDEKCYVDYSFTYESSYQGTTTSKVILSGVTNGQKASISLTDETNSIVKQYHDLAVLNEDVLYINVDPVLNLLEDKEIFISAAPDYYGRKVVAIELKDIKESLETIIATIQNTVRNTLDGTDVSSDAAGVQNGKAIELKYSEEDWLALLNDLSAKLDGERSKTEDAWMRCKDVLLSDNIKTRWSEIIKMDTKGVFNLPAHLSVNNLIGTVLTALIDESKEIKASADEKLCLTNKSGCTSIKHKWTLMSADGDTVSSLLINVTEQNGTVSVPEYGTDRAVALEDFGNHVFDEFKDILTGNYEGADIFDHIEVIGDNLHVYTKDDAADIEYIYLFSSKRLAGCEVIADVYDMTMMNALRAHYEEKGFTLIEASVGELEKGTGKGRLVVRCTENWGIPAEIVSTQSPVELSAIIQKEGILL